MNKLSDGSPSGHIHAKYIAELASEGSLIAQEITGQLVVDSKKTARRWGYVIAANTPEVAYSEKLNEIIADGGDLSPFHKEVLEKGRARRIELIKTIDIDEFSKMPTKAKIDLAFERFLLEGDLEFSNALLKDDGLPELLSGKVIQVHRSNKLLPEKYLDWLLGLVESEAFEEKYKHNGRILEMYSSIIEYGTKSEVDEAFASLKRRKIPLQEFLFKGITDLSLSEGASSKVLDRIDLRMIKDADSIKLGKSKEFISTMISRYYSTGNEKFKNRIPKLINRIGGNSAALFIKSNLNALMEKPIGLPDMLKNTLSQDSYEALIQISKSTDPVVKKNAIDALQFQKGILRQKNFNSKLSPEEYLFISQKLAENGEDYKFLLDRVDPELSYTLLSDSLVAHFNTNKFESFSLHALKELGDDTTAKALGVDAEKLDKILDRGGNDSEALKKTAASVMRKTGLLDDEAKINRLARSGNTSIEAIHLMQELALRSPSDERIISYAAMIFSNDPESISIKQKIEASKLLSRLSSKSMEKVIQYARAENAKYLLAGIKTHRSKALADFAKKHLTSNDPQARKIASEIVQDWKKSPLGYASEAVNCASEGLGSILRRLSFR